MVSAIGRLFGTAKTPPVECTVSEIVLEGDACTVSVERYENGAWGVATTLTGPLTSTNTFAQGAPVRLVSALEPHEQVKYSLKKTS